MTELTEKVAVVTGGAMGIGRVLAEGLAAAGASVIIADLERSEEAAGEIAASGARAIGVHTDVADEESTRAMAEMAQSTFGGVDILVNNAGIYSSLVPEPFEAQSVKEWRRVMDVNVIGTMLATRAVVPLMRARGGGRVINLSSGTPFKGVPFLLHYVASKGAVNAITKALAKELGDAGILVNGVAPGFTLSDGVRANPTQLEKLQQISLEARVIKRDQVPEDLVGAVLFLSGPGAGFITGQTIVVDGGAYFH
jgi:NAD(P)-dependent dehydrogenase (short-subunit alcohol dehydrogenase family)